MYVKQSFAIGFDLIKSDPYCFKVPANTSETIRITYTVSGRSENKCRVQFFSPQGQVLEDLSGKVHGYLKHQPSFPGVFKVCFSRLDMSVKKVDVSISKINMEVETTEKAKGEDVDALMKRIDSIRQDMNRISENLSRSKSVEFSHEDVLKSMKDSLKLFTFVKIIIVFVMCVAQLYFIISFFNSSQKDKLPFKRVQAM